MTTQAIVSDRPMTKMRPEGRRSRNLAMSSRPILSAAPGLIACMTLVAEACCAGINALMASTPIAISTGGTDRVQRIAGLKRHGRPTRSGS